MSMEEDRRGDSEMDGFNSSGVARNVGLQRRMKWPTTEKDSCMAPKRQSEQVT